MSKESSDRNGRDGGGGTSRTVTTTGNHRPFNSPNKSGGSDNKSGGSDNKSGGSGS
ncbi:hypothetical protein NE236_09475 [Actinoallomurus purpureus]|uniref:hypothetical protein n=1 Tax=Actinoallomurus purpureus TaxID=478114 RepID=UPI0020924656|nr:hypothetical protein [Actinoallomurus purpureus]MCO6005214.1 hypothetical protein [Actinoallomurus purpureus]